ncbi:hypothetical protein G4B88_027504 [Cannabis sativa]|uniref:Uncharacterized protein n=1 Tax=Cannabis sativa TaxID=3483 RepID=A0A7J6E2Y9_CANSA|nr:hypothetical protein G4B88_027504 [Cannabis sativa]
MTKSFFFFFFFFFSFVILIVSASSENPTPTPSAVHAELKNFGLPIGLLPSTTVLNYNINQTSGDFSVNLGGACKITLPPDNYLATYSKIITGNIDQGRIAKLDGIRVRAFFKWWSITGIKSSGDNLVFEVGGITVKYPSKNFDEVLAYEVDDGYLLLLGSMDQDVKQIKRIKCELFSDKGYSLEFSCFLFVYISRFHLCSSSVSVTFSI